MGEQGGQVGGCWWSGAQIYPSWFAFLLSSKKSVCGSKLKDQAPVLSSRAVSIIPGPTAAPTKH